MSDLFYYHQNVTGDRQGSNVAPANWDEQVFNISAVIAGDFANSIYFCYLFENSV